MGSEIDFWYGRSQQFGKLGRPQRWINILGTVEPNGLKSLSFSIADGEERPLNVGPDGLRLRAPGDFNAEILYDELPEGVSTVAFRAEYENETSVEDAVQVGVAPRRHWPLPYSVNWREVSSITDAVQVIDGRWTKSDSGIRSCFAHYDRLVTIGDTEWTDYVAEVHATIHGFTSLPGDTGTRGGFGLLFRWTGHVADGLQPAREWRPNGAIAWYRARWDETPPLGRNLNISDAVVKDESLAATEPLELDLDTEYVFSFAVHSQEGHTGKYHFRVWKAAEPGAMICDLVTNARKGEVPKGSILVIANWVDVTIGAVTVRPAD